MSSCPRCGARFGCAMADGPMDEPCWCMDAAAVPRAALPASKDGDRSCLCPRCLRALRIGEAQPSYEQPRSC